MTHLVSAEEPLALVEDCRPSHPVSRNQSAARWAAEVLRVLTEAELNCCVSHGYRGLPDTMGSDLDLLVGRGVNARSVARLLMKHEERVGARLVHVGSSSVVAAGLDLEGKLTFLTIDIRRDVRCGNRVVFDADAILKRRRARLGFTIPAVEDEVAILLCTASGRGLLTDHRARDCELLYREDKQSFHDAVRALWPLQLVEAIEKAAEASDWAEVRTLLPSLKRSVRYQIGSRLGAELRSVTARWVDRVGRLISPPGLSIVLLGPDGAGKSTLSDALFEGLQDVLPRRESWGFAPPIARLIGRRKEQSTSDPHGLPSRSSSTSIVRALYWFVHALLTSAMRRVAKARAAVVVYDRHLVDIFVDRRRYRYGGPTWVLRLLWLLVPKPDLVLLLDVPADLLQQRKQEVPPEVSERQRAAYLDLARTLRNAQVLDGSRSREVVANDALSIVVGFLARRSARRLR